MRLKNTYLGANDAYANAGSNKWRLFVEEDHTPWKNLYSSFTQVSKKCGLRQHHFQQNASSHRTQPSSLTDMMDTNYEFGDCASIVKARTNQANSEGSTGISMAVMLQQFHKKQLFLGVPQDKANAIGIFPTCSSDKFLAKNVMEIVAYAMPKEDWAILST